ncbi:MAG TPA: hypothetical protein VNW26_09440 [Steroidobacteraceae bacterium]|jgi:hypothetical protein|nr:hypothetical protein [Steroidobacteraceae bacterium]
MKFRLLGLAAAFAAIAPAICTASPEQDALNACAHAFASSLASPGALTPTYKVVYGGYRYAESVTDFFARQYTFELHANDQKTGQLIARASCATDLHGNVVALSAIPAEQERPRIGARN